MLTSSQGGGILHYNHLNLPYKLQGGGTIEWLYDASGMKHQKKTTGGPPGENYTKDYILGIEYKDGQIESIMHPEGRACLAVRQAVWFDKPDDQEPGKFIYEYNLKDHLGNVRVVFADKDENGFVWPFYFHGAKGSWYGNNYQDNEDHEPAWPKGQDHSGESLLPLRDGDGGGLGACGAGGGAGLFV